MRITLNDNEIVIAKEIATRRNKSNRAKGIVNQKAGPQSNWQTEIEGVGGEIAFAKALNVYPDFKDAPDDFDVIVGKHSVDVKTTKHYNLEVSTKKKAGSVDVYALVTGSMPNYRVVGWYPAYLVMQKKRLHTHPSGSTVYRVPPTELLSIGELAKWEL